MSHNVLLVVEDDPDDAMLLERALRRAKSGFRMVWVSKADDLIAYLKGSGVYADRVQHPSPRVVLLDLKMPRKDGFSVLEWRQSKPGYEAVPIVVYSSSDLKEDIGRAYLLGANSYVVKPTAPERLDSMVRAFHAWWGEYNATLPASAA